MRRIGAIVRGRVQGVGFRFFTRSLASHFALSGWVRNLPDGNVEVEVQGDEGNIAGFVEKLQKGPALSHVKDVNVCEIEVNEAEKEFEIW